MHRDGRVIAFGVEQEFHHPSTAIYSRMTVTIEQLDACIHAPNWSETAAYPLRGDIAVSCPQAGVNVQCLRLPGIDPGYFKHGKCHVPAPTLGECNHVRRPVVNANVCADLWSLHAERRP
jgi:hypothetical protein